VDANMPSAGPALQHEQHLRPLFQQEQKEVVPKENPQGPNWHPGDAPSQALMWEVDALDKAGTLSIIGVYPQTVRLFPIGQAMMKNLKIHMGNCPHRRYIPQLLDITRTGAISEVLPLTEERPFGDVIEAYKHFDRREPGWLKVALAVQAAQPQLAAA